MRGGIILKQGKRTKRIVALATKKVSHTLAIMGYTEEQVRAVSYEDIVKSRQLSQDQLFKNFKDIREYSADAIELKTAGYELMWNYFADNIFRVRRLSRQDKATSEFNASFYDVMTGKDAKTLNYIVKRTMLTKNMNKSIPTNLTSAFYFGKGAVCTFRPTTAKSLYKKFNATHVLDPTAGWSGRLIGAYGLGIAYTGIDTNTDLKPGYDKLIADLEAPNLNMIWKSCLDVDFESIDYDCVLTSPPYINLEYYEHMTLFGGKVAFYKSFLIPLIEKCLKHIKRNGFVCFNISPDMYEEIQTYGFRKCDTELVLPKNTNKKSEEIVNPEMIYCWRNQNALPIAVAVPRAPAAHDEKKDIRDFIVMMNSKYPDLKISVNVSYT